jgi:phage terminase large subunit-like protein
MTFVNGALAYYNGEIREEVRGEQVEIKWCEDPLHI